MAASGILLLSPPGFCRLCLVLATQPCPVADSVLAGRSSLLEASRWTTQGPLINCLLHAGVQAAAPAVVQLHLSGRVSAVNAPHQVPRHWLQFPPCVWQALCFSYFILTSYLFTYPECSVPHILKHTTASVYLACKSRDLLGQAAPSPGSIWVLLFIGVWAQICSTCIQSEPSHLRKLFPCPGRRARE